MTDYQGVDISRLAEIYRAAVNSKDPGLSNVVREAALNEARAFAFATEARVLSEFARGILA